MLRIGLFAIAVASLLFLFVVPNLVRLFVVLASMSLIYLAVNAEKLLRP